MAEAVYNNNSRDLFAEVMKMNARKKSNPVSTPLFIAYKILTAVMISSPISFRHIPEKKMEQVQHCTHPEEGSICTNIHTRSSDKVNKTLHRPE